MFGTSGIRGPIGDEITMDTALSIGRALPSCGYETIITGRDPRETGIALIDALSSGVRECGGDVIDVGLAATPTVAHAVSTHDADAGVSVTASHNPASDNGIKLWRPDGRAFDEADREAIATCVKNDAYEFAAWNEFGTRQHDETATGNHQEALITHIRELFGGSSEPLSETVIVDVGNGAGQATAVALERLGCTVQTLNGQPDGAFPGRPSEPTAENCGLLQTTVASSDATVGIAHDGDADRMRAVDETGEFLSGDDLLAIFARAAATAGDTVAVPVDTSLAVADTLAEEDISVTRTPVGDVYVAAATTREGVVFGGEPSGAWIWPTETRCPDGPLAACRLTALITREGPLSELAATVDSYPIRRKNIETEQKAAVVSAVADRITERYADDTVDQLDGVRVATEDGWFLVRASGTQPLIRVTAEARTAADVDSLLTTAVDHIHAAREVVER
jgi:phosphoglucosamine mutase